MQPTEFSGNRIGKPIQCWVVRPELRRIAYMVEMAMCAVLFVLAMVLPAFKSYTDRAERPVPGEFEPVIMLNPVAVDAGRWKPAGAAIALTHNGNLQQGAGDGPTAVAYLPQARAEFW